MHLPYKRVQVYSKHIVLDIESTSAPEERREINRKKGIYNINIEIVGKLLFGSIFKIHDTESIYLLYLLYIQKPRERKKTVSDGAYCLQLDANLIYFTDLCCVLVYIYYTYYFDASHSFSTYRVFNVKICFQIVAKTLVLKRNQREIETNIDKHFQ